MTKVIFINRYFAPDESATSRILSDLAFGLAKSGSEIIVITSRQRLEEPDAALPRNEFLDGVRVVRVRTTKFGRQNLIGRVADYLSFYWSAAWALLKYARRGDVVIAKTDPPMFSVFARPCCLLRGAYQINWLQDVFPEVALRLGVGKPFRLVSRLILSIRNWSLRSSTMNVVIGERMKMHLRHQGIPECKLTTIPNWTDTKAIVPIPPEKNPLRHEWKMDNALVIGYSGNLGRAHRFDAIIEACRYFKGDSRVKFLFIGGGAGMSKVKEIVAKEALGGVTFKPYQPRENLSLSLSVPDIHLVTLEPQMEGLIVPSKYYGIAAAGRATVYLGTVDGDIANELNTSKTGITIEAHDGQALIQLIEATLKDQLQSIRDMGANARTLAISEYSLDKGVQRWRTQLSSIARPK